jgi:hypothetical protein
MDGVQEIRPKDEEDWTKVKAAAVNLTEAGNLLMMPPRARDDDQWMRNIQRMMFGKRKPDRCRGSQERARRFGPQLPHPRTGRGAPMRRPSRERRNSGVGYGL